MGSYVYTRRKEVREIDGVKIGQFLYAHKPWGHGEAPRYFERATGAQYAAADRAKAANPDVDLFITQEWKVSEGADSIAVRRFPTRPTAIYDDATDDAKNPIVGYVRKIGKVWHYEAVDAQP